MLANILLMSSKERNNMQSLLPKLIAIALVVAALITIWSVVTPNHLFIS